MGISITINDLDNLSDLERQVLATALEGTVATTEKPKPKPAKKAQPKSAPEPEPEEEDEDLLGDDGPTMKDAVAKATELVSGGDAAKVKSALADLGVKRVSELKDGDIPAFLSALEG